MAILLLTVNEHQLVLKNLIDLSRQIINKTSLHSAGPHYSSLMISFLMHNLSSAESLLRLQESFSNEWFPTTIGYCIVRPMFEIDVTSHYISKQPLERSLQYIDYGKIIKHKQLKNIQTHLKSNNSNWGEGLQIQYTELSPKENEIIQNYNKVISKYTHNKKGKNVPFQTWTGKSLRQMAVEVNHEEAYDIFYSELSSFTHADVHLADRFLRVNADGLSWSMKANEYDVGAVFRYAAIFFTCYLELFGKEFGTITEADVQNCWMVK